MENRRERRRFPRTALDPAEVGFVLYQTCEAHEENYKALYVDIMNRSQKGLNLRTKQQITPSTSLYIQIYDPWVREWLLFEGQIRWINQDHVDPAFYLYGIELKLPDAGYKIPWNRIVEQKKMPLPEDYQFFRRTKLLTQGRRSISGG